MSKRATTDDALLARLARATVAIPGTVPPDPAASAADRALAHLALLAAPDLAPPDDMLARIEAQLDAEAPGDIRTFRAEDGRWAKVMPGIWMKTLTKRPDGKGRMILLRCEPGAVIPAHRHEEPEHVFVLEGSYVMGDIVVSAGDSQFSPGGTTHPDLTSHEGCLLLLYS